MSKHQEILSYLEELPVGKRVSVRSISNHLGVSDGTAYRAIKEAENRGIVETRQEVVLSVLNLRSCYREINFC